MQARCCKVFQYVPKKVTLGNASQPNSIWKARPSSHSISWHGGSMESHMLGVFWSRCWLFSVCHNHFILPSFPVNHLHIPPPVHFLPSLTRSVPLGSDSYGLHHPDFLTLWLPIGSSQWNIAPEIGREMLGYYFP